jgi:hypothetical protein
MSCLQDTIYDIILNISNLNRFYISMKKNLILLFLAVFVLIVSCSSGNTIYFLPAGKYQMTSTATTGLCAKNEIVTSDGNGNIETSGGYELSINFANNPCQSKTYTPLDVTVVTETYSNCKFESTTNTMTAFLKISFPQSGNALPPCTADLKLVKES